MPGLLLLLLTVAEPDNRHFVPSSTVRAAAEVTVQIRHAATIDAKTWTPSADHHEREVVDRRADPPLPVRLTEFE